MPPKKTDDESPNTPPAADKSAELLQRIADLETLLAAATPAPPAPAAPPPNLGPTPADAPIVDKLIAKKREFEVKAQAAKEKTFEPLQIAKAYRLSPKAFALYQEWAKAADAAHPHDTRLHEIFAGLTVSEDVDLAGESVFVD